MAMSRSKLRYIKYSFSLVLFFSNLSISNASEDDVPPASPSFSSRSQLSQSDAEIPPPGSDTDHIGVLISTDFVPVVIIEFRIFSTPGT